MSTSLLQLYISSKILVGLFSHVFTFSLYFSKVTVSKIKPPTYQLFLETLGLPKYIKVFNNAVSFLKGSALNYVIEALNSTHSSIRSHELFEHLMWRLEECLVCIHGLSCACVCVCVFVNKYTGCNYHNYKIM